MDIILDTQIILWAINGDKRLTKKDSLVFLDPDNTLYFSIAGYWEIAIKTSIGKLQLSDQWPKIIKREMQHNFIKLLPITMQHCNCLAKLPFHHRDPFDRIIIAQAQIEKMTLLSSDSQFKKYSIDLI